MGASPYRSSTARGRRLSSLAGAVTFAALVVLAGIPARTTDAAAGPVVNVSELPEVVVVPSDDVSTQLDRQTALKIASDLVSGLRTESEALASGDAELAATVAGGARLAALYQQMTRRSRGPGLPRRARRPDAGGRPRARAAARRRRGLDGTRRGRVRRDGGDPRPFQQTLELELQDGRYLIVGLARRASVTAVTTSAAHRAGAGLGGVRLADVARHVGLDFRHGAFRFETSPDPVAMMGGGICWLDFDGDGWLDLYAVNSHSIQVDVARWKERGGLPRNALYRNEKGRFADVSRGSGADLQLRGNGCVAADFNGDGRTDLYVTAAGYDALLWNLGGGKFAEGASAAGIDTYGWHTAASVGRRERRRPPGPLRRRLRGHECAR